MNINNLRKKVENDISDKVLISKIVSDLWEEKDFKISGDLKEQIINLLGYIRQANKML